jgi:hypothetical protein
MGRDTKKTIPVESNWQFENVSRVVRYEYMKFLRVLSIVKAARELK